MKHYKLTPCTGPIEPLKNDNRASVLYRGRFDVIYYALSVKCWRFLENDEPVRASDWPHIEVLKEVEGVVMSRDQLQSLCEDAIIISKKTNRRSLLLNHINNLFK